jgi:hypothetical protein
MWNNEKTRLDMVPKREFFDTKGSIQADGIGPWRDLQAPYGENFSATNGDLRVEPIFGIFVLK